MLLIRFFVPLFRLSHIPPKAVSPINSKISTPQPASPHSRQLLLLARVTGTGGGDPPGNPPAIVQSPLEKVRGEVSPVYLYQAREGGCKGDLFKHLISTPVRYLSYSQSRATRDTTSVQAEWILLPYTNPLRFA